MPTPETLRGGYALITPPPEIAPIHTLAFCIICLWRPVFISNIQARIQGEGQGTMSNKPYPPPLEAESNVEAVKFSYRSKIA